MDAHIDNPVITHNAKFLAFINQKIRNSTSSIENKQHSAHFTSTLDMATCL